jgi:ABC-type glycerol-3-phosphate transport system permease component
MALSSADAAKTGLTVSRPKSGPWSALPMIVLYVVIITPAVLWLFPVVTMISSAMKSGDQIYLEPFPWQLPQPLALWENLQFAWTTGGLGAGFANSLIYGLVGATGATLVASLAAYSLVRLKPPGRFYWFLLIYSGTIFPFQMLLVPLFNLYVDTGLYDTKLGMMLFYAAISTPFCLFVMNNFFSTIPKEVSEAAILDGASDFRVFWNIYLPLSVAALAVLFLFQFTWIWNDLLFGLILSKSEAVRPVMPSLAGMMGVYSTISFASVLAGGLIASIPTIALFVTLQRYFAHGLALSSASR